MTANSSTLSFLNSGDWKLYGSITFICVIFLVIAYYIFRNNGESTSKKSKGGVNKTAVSSSSKPAKVDEHPPSSSALQPRPAAHPAPVVAKGRSGVGVGRKQHGTHIPFTPTVYNTPTNSIDGSVAVATNNNRLALVDGFEQGNANRALAVINISSHNESKRLNLDSLMFSSSNLEDRASSSIMGAPITIIPAWSESAESRLAGGTRADVFGQQFNDAVWSYQRKPDSKPQWSQALTQRIDNATVARNGLPERSKMVTRIRKDASSRVYTFTSRMADNSTETADFFTSTIFVDNSSTERQRSFGWNLNLDNVRFTCIYSRRTKPPFNIFTLTALRGCVINSTPVNIVILNGLVQSPTKMIDAAWNILDRQFRNTVNPFINKTEQTFFSVNCLTPKTQELPIIMKELEAKNEVNNRRRLIYEPDSLHQIELKHHVPATFMHMFDTKLTTTVYKTSFFVRTISTDNKYNAPIIHVRRGVRAIAYDLLNVVKRQRRYVHDDEDAAAADNNRHSNNGVEEPTIEPSVSYEVGSYYKQVHAQLAANNSSKFDFSTSSEFSEDEDNDKNQNFGEDDDEDDNYWLNDVNVSSNLNSSPLGATNNPNSLPLNSIKPMNASESGRDEDEDDDDDDNNDDGYFGTDNKSAIQNDTEDEVEDIYTTSNVGMIRRHRRRHQHGNGLPSAPLLEDEVEDNSGNEKEEEEEEGGGGGGGA